jgi:hypothetical protein
MGSFSCQHIDVEMDACLLLKTDCVPGRKGCVLRGKSKFAVPAEERVRLKEEEKRAKPTR